MIAHPPVGAAGFEPATSWSQTRRDDRTTLRPEQSFHFFNSIWIVLQKASAKVISLFINANKVCYLTQ